MAEPAWKTPTKTPVAPERDDLEDSAEVSEILRWVKGPDGRLELLELPLTRELFLDPKLGDIMIQGDWHDVTARELADLLENHFRGQADVRVFHDLKHYLLPGSPAPAPDVSVVLGLRPRRRRNSFSVKREGVRPCLVIEVVSPASAEARHSDLVDKVELYQRAGIAEYLIADSPGKVTGLPFKLLGYRLDARGRYRPMKPDAEGRFLSETTGLWFQVSPDGQRILLFEHPTGRRLLNLAEQEERAEAAEEKAASAEAEAARLRKELERLRRN